MKKILSLILTLTMALAFVACGKKTAFAPYDAAECVGKNMSSVESDFTEAGFENVITEKIEDLKYTEADRVGAVESVSVGETTTFSQEQEFSKDDEVVIRYHALGKCTVAMHVDFISNLIFSKYDVILKVNGEEQGVLNHGEDKDFNFTIYPGECTIKFEEKGSSNVNGAIVLELKGESDISLKISCHSDRIDLETLFIEDRGALGENETMISAECVDYGGQNFEEYGQALKTAGFTNITFDPIYDIASNSSGIGEIEKVTIDGTSEFERGNIFAKDVAVVITYHASEDDDPVKQAQAAAEAALENVLPKEMARRAVIVAMTNGHATDVFQPDRNTLDPSKFHAYSDIDDFLLLVDADGTWSVHDESAWHVDGMILRFFKYDTCLKVSCNIKKEENNYIVFNVNRKMASKEYIDSDDSSKFTF